MASIQRHGRDSKLVFMISMDIMIISSYNQAYMIIDLKTIALKARSYLEKRRRIKIAKETQAQAGQNNLVP